MHRYFNGVKSFHDRSFRFIHVFYRKRENIKDIPPIIVKYAVGKENGYAFNYLSLPSRFGTEYLHYKWKVNIIIPLEIIYTSRATKYH